jgi:hypothetical protein
MNCDLGHEAKGNKTDSSRAHGLEISVNQKSRGGGAHGVIISGGPCSRFKIQG